MSFFGENVTKNYRQYVTYKNAVIKCVKQFREKCFEKIRFFGNFYALDGLYGGQNLLFLVPIFVENFHEISSL